MISKNRITALLLLSAMTASMLASCGGEDKPTGGDTTVPADTTTAAPETRDTLPEGLDFGGQTLTFFVRSDPPSPEFYINEQTGEIVDDAVYNRNLNVTERLNVNFDFYEIPGAWGDRKNFANALSASVMANDSTYDIVAGYSMAIASLAAGGMLCDLASTEHLNFNQPWWVDSLLGQSSVNGKLYFASGDISTSYLYMLIAMYFNKDMIEDYNLESPYDLVESGNWTIPKMLEMTKDVYGDLNGDGKKDFEDRYGLVLGHVYNDAFYFASGLRTTDIENGIPKLSKDFESERVNDLVTMMCTALHSTNDCYSAPDAESLVFEKGNVMFTNLSLDFAKSCLRNVKFNYGIVPMPKYDAEQDDYFTTMSFGYTLYGIPLDAKDPDMSSAVLEALASESYRSVSPALFEVAMKVKYSPDDQASQMYDLIRETVLFDFGRVFTDELGALTYSLYRSSIVNNNTAWASRFGAEKERMTTMLDTLVANFSNS